MRPLSLALGTLLALTQTFAADIKVTPNEAVDIAQEGKVVARFMTAHDVSTPAKRLETYKPYLHVFDPSGALRLTKGPGFNFTHHRGIMLGFAKITIDGKTYDRWHMSGGDQVVTAIKPTTRLRGIDRLARRHRVGEADPDRGTHLHIHEADRTLLFRHRDEEHAQARPG